MSSSLSLRLLVALSLMLLAFISWGGNHSNAGLWQGDACGQIVNYDRLRLLEMIANIPLYAAAIGASALVWSGKNSARLVLSVALFVCAILSACFAYQTQTDAKFLTECDIFVFNPDTVSFLNGLLVVTCLAVIWKANTGQEAV
ncbi:MAG: hypothetical protein I8H94_01930 [Rhodobacteraceae bacterium]|nr:hypothetical protein [Paracoccaceae bacterium]